MFANFGSDLAIGHLVHGLNGKDPSFQSFTLKMFFQLSFCLSGTKNLDRVCIMNNSENLVVKIVEVVPELPVSCVFG